MLATHSHSEHRAEQLLEDLLKAQGWDLRHPPAGEVLWQHEYRHYPHLADALDGASKTGPGFGIPEAIILDKSSLIPLAVVEVKATLASLDTAISEATTYASCFIEHDYHVLAIGIAGAYEYDFDLRVMKWQEEAWTPITYDGRPIRWIPNRFDLETVLAPAAAPELRPTVPPSEVLSASADEINRILRESGITDQARPAIVGAAMLALWSSQGNLRKDPKYLLQDINQACEQAYWRTQKPEIARSLHIDEANKSLAQKARRIVEILDRLNVTVLTAEHDYLGQLYEGFFQYTGGNTIGQYFTPRHITQLMAELAQVDRDDVVLDPACGTGGFLIAAMQRILDTGNLSRAQVINIVRDRLIGFENEPTTAALCVANMILRGDGSTGITRDNCFTSDDYPVGQATVVLMNPPFPHKQTDIPPERFIERGLEGLCHRGRLAAIVPNSLLVKSGKKSWRAAVLRRHTLLSVVQLPDDLFQPYSSSTTSIVIIEKGRPQTVSEATVFVRLAHDGHSLSRRARIAKADEPDQIPDAIDAILNKSTVPGFSGIAKIEGTAEWGVGQYIESPPLSEETLFESADTLLRRLASFYVRYAAEIVMQRTAIEMEYINESNYDELLSTRRLQNARSLPSRPGTIGGAFDIYYGMKELHSREGIPPGNTLVISPTEEYNGTYGWLAFDQVISPPFLTAAQTGSIGETFVQLEPCAVNDDCLVLVPREQSTGIADLVVSAAVLRLERWRFTYGRKLTPSRIAEFPLPQSESLRERIAGRINSMQNVIESALALYADYAEQLYSAEDKIDADIARARIREINVDPAQLVTGSRLAERLSEIMY